MYKIILFICLTFGILFGAGVDCDISKPTSYPKVVVDKSGKKHTLESKANRAFGVAPFVSNLIYTIREDSLIGLNYEPYPEDKIFMKPEILALPILGVGVQNISIERVLSLKPDVFFTSPLVSDKPFEERLEKFGVRVVYLSFHTIEEMRESAMIVGKILGEEAKSECLNRFADKMFGVLKLARADLEKEGAKKPKIYFAQGIDGLTTECGVYLSDMLYASIMPECDGKENRFGIDFERLYSYSPDAIFVREVATYKDMIGGKSKRWNMVKAVKDKKVFYPPSSPIAWLNRPASIFRFIGIPWAFDKLHSGKLDRYIKLDDEIRFFYEEFLNTSLDKNSLHKLYNPQ